MDLQLMLMSFGTMIAGILIIAEFVDKFWKLQGTASQVRSLVVGALLGEVGAYFKLGFFADPLVLGTMAWYLGGGVIGISAGLAANWSFMLPLIQAVLTFLKLRVPTGNGQTGVQTTTNMAKKVLPVVAILLIAASVSTAQTFDNFWHPRPKVAVAVARAEVASVPLWEFKPTFQVSATRIRAGVTSADGLETTFLSAAGPALTLQKTTQTADGLNYAEYSGSLALLMTGSTTQGPTFQPAVALSVGFFNNLLQVGAGYELTAVTASRQRLFGLVSIGVNLTNN